MASILVCATMIATKRRGVCRNTPTHPTIDDLLSNASMEKKAYISEEQILSEKMIVDAKAREAKQRLDKKLQGSKSQENLAAIVSDLGGEVPKENKYGGKRLRMRWLKLKWKFSYKCTSS